MKYYKVVVVRGHMGTKYNHATMTFYEKANDMLTAIDNARKHGGVKHRKIPVNASEITAQEYYENRSTNAYDKACCRKDKGVIFSFLRLFDNIGEKE